MLITKTWLQAYRTEKGGWTKAQLACLDVEWPPRHGWMKRVVGEVLSEEQARVFEASVNVTAES